MYADLDYVRDNHDNNNDNDSNTNYYNNLSWNPHTSLNICVMSHSAIN